MEPMLKTMHKNCLSSQSCKFVKNYFSKIIFLHAHVQCVCIVVAKYQTAPAIRAVAGQRSSPDLCFATKSIKIYDIDLNVTQVDRDGTAKNFRPIYLIHLHI